MRSSTHGRRILAAPGAQPSASTRSTIWSICAPASSSMTKARRRIDRRKWTPTRTMIDRLELRLQLKPHRLVGDTAYGTASLLGWMVEKKAIEPHVPVWDKSQRQDATFSSSEFQWRPQPMNTVVRRDMHFAAPVGSKVLIPQSPRTARSFTDQIRPTVRNARSRIDAVQTRQHAESNAASTKPRETSLEGSQ
jgi:hypothetical protein